MTAPADQPFRLGALAIPVYLPSALFSLGAGAMLPIVPSLAANLGSGLALAGLIAGLYMIGELVGDLPSGAIVARLGERWGMVAASGVGLLGAVAVLLAPAIWTLATGVFLIGLAAATFALARHSFLTTFVPLGHRARALSTLGGVFRVGTFVGPLLGGAVIHFVGAPASAMWVAVIAFALAGAFVAFMADPTEILAARRAEMHRQSQPVDSGRFADEDPPTGPIELPDADGRRQGLWRTLRDQSAVLVRMGPAALLIAGLRSSRQVILPLWAVSMGLPDTTISWVIGLTGALDFALFYAGGWIMDRFGRGYTAIPTQIGLGLGHLLLAALAVAADSFAGFVAVAIFLALANGVGAGILMTLGSDLAPPANPTPFLAAWRFIGDAGQAGAPLLIAAVTAAWSLAAASAVLGVLGLLGAGLVARYLPRYIPAPVRG